MSYPKIARLIQVLSERTDSGGLTWDATERNETFQASFPRYSVRLFIRTLDNQHTVDYVLQIINENGEIVEEVSDPDLTDVMHEPYKTMGRLHDTARRSAMGVEDALDDILNYLEPF